MSALVLKMSEDLKFNARKQKSFDYASEGAKQLITLAAGITAFTVTFTKDAFIQSNVQVTNFGKWMLIFSWLFYILSIIAGLLTIFTLAGQLTIREYDNSLEHNPVIMHSPVKIWMAVQQLSFILGSLYVSLFGASNLSLTSTSLSGYPLYICLAIIVIIPVYIIWLILKRVKFTMEKEIIFNAYIEKNNYEMASGVKDLLTANVKLNVAILAEKPDPASHVKVHIRYLPKKG